MGTPLEDEKENSIKEIHGSILRIQKKIDYIISQFILYTLFKIFINNHKPEEVKNMENKFEIPTLDDLKKGNQYEHPVLLESFVNIEDPVIDTHGYIRDKKNETNLGKDYYTGTPVQTIESPDVKKIQNDYKRLEDKFDEMTMMFRMMMNEMKELRKENQEFRKENQEFRKDIQEIKKENQELKQSNIELRNELVRVNRRLDESEERNRNLVLDNQRLMNAQIPSLRIVNQHNKRVRRDEVYGSDNEDGMQNVPLMDKDSESLKWNPAIGLRDTFSIFTPRSVLTQQKQENELRRAAYNGDIDRLRLMLVRNKSIINGRGMPDSLCSLVSSFKDKTALMIASEKGHVECVRELLKNGASVNLWDRDEKTALSYAAERNHREVYKLLTEYNALQAVEIPELNKEDEGRKHKLI